MNDHFKDKNNLYNNKDDSYNKKDYPNDTSGRSYDNNEESNDYENGIYKDNPYNDIINLPHHVSATRPHMSSENRAAQFSPFAALTGYDSAVKETARLTDVKAELDEDARSLLDMKLHILEDMVHDNPQISLTYFKKDGIKSGGAYITVVDRIKKINGYKKIISLMNGDNISIEDIMDIECDVFDHLVII